LTSLSSAVDAILAAQKATQKPLAIILAGHNGSGKSTMWRRSLADTLRIPLINADRMMLSILPEAGEDGFLPDWAATLRDQDRSWMSVAQQGVSAFVGHAMAAKAPFAMETVFSYWEPQEDGSVLSKIDLIHEMQRAGYFVLLFFVGLASPELSILRVETRKSEGGHGIDEPTLRKRFPKTQRAIAAAVRVADAAILTDNSRSAKQAFTVCRVQIGAQEVFDLRRSDKASPPSLILAWLNKVAPDA
jgi:predicted ABC-type ATPase